MMEEAPGPFVERAVRIKAVVIGLLITCLSLAWHVDRNSQVLSRTGACVTRKVGLLCDFHVECLYVDLSHREQACNVLWKGLTLDWAFYAGATWLVFAWVATRRRRRWRRDGRCATCGYNLKGLPLPRMWGMGRRSGEAFISMLARPHNLGLAYIGMLVYHETIDVD